MASESDVVEFSEIRITFPKGMIRRCYWKQEYLTAKETRKLRIKSAEIKKSLSKLQHVDTVVDKCLLKAGGGRGEI